MKSAVYSDEVVQVCRSIGMNLKSLRINQLGEKQDVMASRLGVSRDTYIRMEKGDPSVKIGFWLEAARITRSLDQWQALFAAEQSLFSQFDAARKKRQRVRD